METTATPPAVPAGSIVVGIDGSAGSDRALDWAATQANAEHRPLVVVIGTRVLGGTAWIAGSGADPLPVLEELREAGLQMLDDAVERVRLRQPDLEVHPVLEEADGETAVLRHAEDAALVVVGSRGRGAVRSRLLGSVSLAVARHAPCPVAVIRPHHPGVVRHGVLVGSDGTASALPLLEHAHQHASVHGLPLTVVLALWDVATPGAAQVLTAPPELTEARLMLAETMSGLAEKYPDVSVESLVVHGDPADVLVEHGDRMDVVLVGRHERRGIRRLLEGSVTASVVERAHTPVIVVPVPLDD